MTNPYGLIKSIQNIICKYHIIDGDAQKFLQLC